MGVGLNTVLRHLKNS
ncbi:TPA: hypothetical protein L9073_005587, partial [Klebsiella pneumoniae]|nr:hypothetical protein [Klebsiella pneumoniae]MCC4949975.1 hypothetical protein [Klebsiella pneumoniae]MCC4970224.1 hypothetical protein [Klebsiella pneumoniae]MCC4976220.1 hypothetical protein [Klebsiella pneumoniae]MCC4992317.1 hypothetical protein [Klebsiella pneumoniae]